MDMTLESLSTARCMVYFSWVFLVSVFVFDYLLTLCFFIFLKGDASEVLKDGRA